MPHRYGKNGELLIAYDETEAGREVCASSHKQQITKVGLTTPQGERRRSSIAAPAGVEKHNGNESDDNEKKEIV